jgi:phosphoglycolate phosphatase
MHLLALFDVDGTLLLSHDELALEAFIETLAERFPVVPSPDALDRVDHPGQTALRIARLVLQKAGVSDDQIDEGLGNWCTQFAERYLELLADADTSRWEAAPGAASALSRLEDGRIRLALLTGNPESMAHVRMERLALSRFFPHGQGAFGCDGETKRELSALARERAGDWPAGETVAVGDTPHDAESAHESGIRSIVVRSGRDDAGSFPLADAICEDIGAVAAQLLAWSG